jgi:hypothetical protein
MVSVNFVPNAFADRHPYAAPAYTTPVMYPDTPIVQKNLWIPMRDGNRLAADIYFPAQNGQRVNQKFPVLLSRTPYDKSLASTVAEAQYFARRGYIVAVQDVRGRCASGNHGLWLGYDDGHQGPDGYDTVEWLATDPGVNSTGKVGMYGWSYLGVTQYAAAAMNPPHLTAIAPGAGHSDYYRIGQRNHGAFEMRFYYYAYTMAQYCNKYVDADPAIGRTMKNIMDTQNFWPMLDLWPAFPGQTALKETPDYERFYFLVATSSDWPGPSLDAPGGFWTYPGLNFEMYYQKAARIGMYHLTGWYDTYTEAAPENFTAFSKMHKSPQHLLVGPRIHTTNWFNTYAGDAEFGPAAAMDYDQFVLRWMDQELKGINSGLNAEPPVTLWIMGGGSGTRTVQGRLNVGGQWVWEDEYPLKRTKYRNWYFWPDRSLKPAAVPKSKAKAVTYIYDPKNPVPSIGGNISAFGNALVAGGFDQVLTKDFYVRGVRNNGQPLSDRPDVISFQTEPLEEDMELTGPIKVILYASSTAVDTDFTAKIVDVYPANADYPGGYALNLEDGIVRARYREGRTDDRPTTPNFIEPGKIYEFTIRPYDVGNLFRKGHRLRVDISSSNYPRFDLNPNTGEPLALHTHTIPATNTIYLSKEYPSHVIVPFIPARIHHDKVDR